MKLEPQEYTIYTFSITAPNTIDMIYGRTLTFEATGSNISRNSRDVPVVIRAIEGKPLSMKCDRNEECLSGNCFAQVSWNIKQCMPEGLSPPPIEPEPVDIMDEIANGAESPEGFAAILAGVGAIIIIVGIVGIRKYRG